VAGATGLRLDLFGLFLSQQFWDRISLLFVGLIFEEFTPKMNVSLCMKRFHWIPLLALLTPLREWFQEAPRELVFANKFQVHCLRWTGSEFVR
jgi:hypothetical protein